MADPDVELTGPVGGGSALQPLWAVVPAAEYDFRCWDGEAVVFVGETADTHLLSREATLLVMTLQSDPDGARPASGWAAIREVDSEGRHGRGGRCGQVGEAIAPALETQPAPSDIPDMEELLSELHRIGLVRRLQP